MLKTSLDWLASTGAGMEIHGVRLAPRLCARSRHRRSTCSACVEACPVQAVTLAPGVNADVERCTGCRTCAAVCPTGAFTGVAPTVAGLLNRIARPEGADAAVAFACPRSIDAACAGIPGSEDRYVSIPCLGMLDAAALVGAASLGLRVWLVDAACTGAGAGPCSGPEPCPWQTARLAAERAVQEANRLLAAWTGEPRIFTAPALPPDMKTVGQAPAPEPAISRRSLLTFTPAPRQAAANAFDEPPPPAAVPALGPARPQPAYVPPNRAVLLAALRRLGRPALSAGVETSLFALFSFDDRCTGCQMCAFFCPTGALRKIERDGAPGLSFRPALCTNCGLCRDICYRDAVGLRPVADLQAIVDGRETIFWPLPVACEVSGLR